MTRGGGAEELSVTTVTRRERFGELVGIFIGKKTHFIIDSYVRLYTKCNWEPSKDIFYS